MGRYIPWPAVQKGFSGKYLEFKEVIKANDKPLE
jgi:hypothetical protein